MTELLEFKCIYQRTPFFKLFRCRPTWMQNLDLDFVDRKKILSVIFCFRIRCISRFLSKRVTMHTRNTLFILLTYNSDRKLIWVRDLVHSFKQFWKHWDKYIIHHKPCKLFSEDWIFVRIPFGFLAILLYVWGQADRSFQMFLSVPSKLLMA